MKNLCSSIALFISVFLWVEKTSAQSKKATDSLSIIQAIAAVEQHPADFQRHLDYLGEIGKTYAGMFAKQDTILSRQYESWIKKFPQEPTVFYTYSRVCANANKNYLQLELLQKTVKLDPKYQRAWKDLADQAWIKGDDSLYRQATKQLTKLDSTNTRYALEYAASYAESDTATAHQLLRQLAIKNPNTEDGAKAIFNIAWDLKDTATCISYYEWLRRDFSTYKIDPFEAYITGFERGMQYYYSYLLKVDPAKALALAEEVWQKPAVNQHGDWKERILLAKNFIRLKELVRDGKTEEAMALLDASKPRSEVFDTLKDEYFFTKLQLLATTGRERQAYDTAFARYVRYPETRMGEQLFAFGAQLGKSKNTVQNELRLRRLDSAKSAENFNLIDHRTGKKMSLKSMRGKVVLLTYWFPSCGPCKEEFVHFEKVLKKYSRDEIVYVAINLDNAQQDAALPLIKSKGYSFISLKDDAGWNKGNLTARGAPTNFLISKEGKIIFDHFMIRDDANEVALEQMIRDAQNINIPVADEKQLLSDSGKK